MKRIAMLFAVCGAPAAAGDTIYVEPGQSIQAAIAQAAGGDIVAVAPGVYCETVDLMGKPIVLRSTDGPAQTILDGTGLGRSVIRCEAGEGPATIIQGLTITGGTTGEPIYNASGGGGIFIFQSSPTILGCIVIGNQAMADVLPPYGLYIGYGGGLLCYGGAPLIVNCSFIGNIAGPAGVWGAVASRPVSPTGYGGGVYARDADLHLVNCSFILNEAAYGGGVFLWGGRAKISGGELGENSATTGASALQATSTDLTLDGCVIRGHDGDELLSLNGPSLVIDCSVIDNRGSIVLRRNVSVVGSRFHGNTVEYQPLIDCRSVWSSPRLDMVNCLLTGNAATALVDTNAWPASIANCTFAANTGHVLEASPAAVVSNCILWDCDATPIAGAPTVVASIVQGGYEGEGVLDVDPLLRDPDGPDDILGTADDDARLGFESPAIDAGDAAHLPADAWDLDGDGLTDEALPVDLAWRPRIARAALDLGAFELPGCLTDLDGDGTVGGADLSLLIVQWGDCEGCPADLDGSGVVGIDDLIALLLRWGECPH